MFKRDYIQVRFPGSTHLYTYREPNHVFKRRDSIHIYTPNGLQIGRVVSTNRFRGLHLGRIKTIKSAEVFLTDGFDLVGPFRTTDEALNYKTTIIPPNKRFQLINFTDEDFEEPGFGIQFEAYSPQEYIEKLKPEHPQP